jgi:hypothetical protein
MARSHPSYPSGHFVLSIDNELAVLDGVAEVAGMLSTLWSASTLNVLNKTLAGAINIGRMPSAGKILSVGYDGKVKQTREVTGLQFAKIEFEQVGAMFNLADTVQVTVSGTSKILPGDGSTVPMSKSGMLQQPWLRCHYKLELGNLPTQKVSAIGAITIVPPGNPQDFLISVQQIDAALYRQALKSSAPMKAVVKYLTPALTTLCSLTFPSARIKTEVMASPGLRDQPATPAQFMIAPGKATFAYGP